VYTDDRRTGVSSGVSTGREATLELVRALLDVGFAAMHHQVLAIRGDRLALVSRRIEREDGFVLSLLTVVEVDAQGRFTLNVLFDEDDHRSAVEVLEHRHLERFAEPMAPTPALENAATRALEQMRELFAARDWDGFADMHPDEVVLDDRRTGVNSGITTGRDAAVALTRGLADVGFVSVDYEVLAVRGERLVLMLRRWRRQDGFELPVVAVQEVDDQGLQIWIALFDPDDLQGAMEALEERHLAQLGESTTGRDDPHSTRR
jgi:limonene-1,2-epoxide hydrolase